MINKYEDLTTEEQSLISKEEFDEIKEQEAKIIIYGVRCSWWGVFGEHGTLPTPSGNPGIPCCPHCRSVLYETVSDEWYKHLDELEAQGCDGYKEFYEWTRQCGRCFRSQVVAAIAYRAETGKDVVLPKRRAGKDDGDAE